MTTSKAVDEQNMHKFSSTSTFPSNPACLSLPFTKQDRIAGFSILHDFLCHHQTMLMVCVNSKVTQCWVPGLAAVFSYHSPIEIICSPSTRSSEIHKDNPHYTQKLGNLLYITGTRSCHCHSVTACLFKTSLLIIQLAFQRLERSLPCLPAEDVCDSS